ncbi:hypothetical protein B0H13DRAFT_2320581 [Mycena leptocephala]|nr:hypothetical protein B0H13DRAFT_2320581 [Mycena leptocephala]
MIWRSSFDFPPLPRIFILGRLRERGIRRMHSTALPRWRIALVLYLFFHLASSAPVVRKSALNDDPSTPFAVLLEQVSTLLSSSTAVVTLRSAVETTINGIPTATNHLTTSTSAVLIRSSTDTIDSANPGIVALSITIGVTALLCFACLILCLIMRRRKPLPTTQISPAQGPESSENIRPHFDSEYNVHRASWASYIDRVGELTRSSTISTRQLVISNQVNRARRKVTELEEMSTLLRALSNSSREDRTRPTSAIDHDVPPLAAEDGSVNIPSDSDLLGVQEQLERAIRQIEGLNDRIRELEHQRRSSWALGLSDEPPPGYTKEPE